MFKTVQKAGLSAGAIAALALGGSAFAGAESDTPTSTATAPNVKAAALSTTAAANVKAAALAKVPGATVLRTDAGGPYNTVYHAHIRTSDGKLEVVLVNSSFEATSVQADNGRGRGGRRDGPGHGHGGPGGGETALTGTTKDKVEAAVLDKYPGATIERTETNGDSTAPYESHITTKDGKELEVLVGSDFAVVTAREHP